VKNHNFVGLVILLIAATVAMAVVGLVKLGVAVASGAVAPSPSPAVVYAPIFEETAKGEESADHWMKPSGVADKRGNARSLAGLIMAEMG
jgi:hypothetical protein